MSKAAELAALIGSQTAQTGRNLLINGEHKVSQRGTSFTAQGANGGPYFTDRWYAYSGGTSAGRFTATQEAITDLAGFTSAIKFDCTTADTSIGADEQLSLIQAVEAQNLQRLKFGTSDAVPLTYSFYAKANAAKTYIAELYAIDGTAQSQSHAFNVTTSWQRFEITFSATGANAATINNDNGVGLYVNINLHAGSNLTSGTINSTWLAATPANRMPGCESFFSSTDNTFFMTGAQLEIGETATPFEHRSFGDELARCKRYFERFERQRPGAGSAGTTSLWAGPARSGASNVQGPMHYVEKRNNPTISVSSAGHLNAIYPISPFNAALSGFGIDGNAGTQSAYINATGSGSPGSDCASFVYIGDAAGYLDIDAEL